MSRKQLASEKQARAKTLTADELRARCARADMKKARKLGYLLIAQTRIGAVALTATLSTKRYSTEPAYWYALVIQGPGTRTVVEGHSRDVLPEVAKLYLFEDTE